MQTVSVQGLAELFREHLHWVMLWGVTNARGDLNATYRSHCLDSFVSEPVEFDAGKCTNTYLVPREYVDEAERGRIADTIL